MEQFVNMLLVALMSAGQPASPRPMVLIDNWPALRVTEHLVAAMPAGCNPNGGGCAVINFAERSCDVYIAWREPQKAVMREREMKRCRGYDAEPFQLREAYVRWLSGQPCKPDKERPRKEGETKAVVAVATMDD